MKCKNCGNEFEGHFCNQCGQKASVGKFTLRNLLLEISANIFQIDHGFFYTLKNLFKRPGHTIREYLDGERKTNFKPIAYVLVIATLYFILNRIFDRDNIIDDFLSGFNSAVNEKGNNDKDLNFLKWFSNNFAYTILLLIPFFSLATYITFIKRGRNYIEHIVINTFVAGQQLIFWIFFLLIEIIVGFDDFLEFFAFLLAFVFKFWTYIQLFNNHNKIGTGLLLFLSYLIFLIFMFLLTGLVTSI
jgi:hypothetical protein